MANLRSSTGATSREATLSTENCARRSPRLSSTPLKSEETLTKLSSKRRVSKSDLLALSVYVIGDDEPSPLNTVDPYNSGEKSMRRSPRFAGDENKVKLQKCPPALSQSRRSPRLCSSLVETGGDGSDVIQSKSEGKMGSNLKLMDSPPALSQLRRSPRQCSALLDTGHDSSDVILSKSESKMGTKLIEWPESSEKRRRFGAALSQLRRSPRLSSETGGDGSDVIFSKSEGKMGLDLIELPESSEKRRRFGVAFVDSSDSRSSKKARTCLAKCNLRVSAEKILRRSPRLHGAEIGNVKCELFALPASSSKKQSLNKIKTCLGESDSNAFGEKRLRLRTIPFDLEGAENEENKSDLIEFSDDSTVSEKCIISRKIPFQVGTENEENKCDLVEFNDDSEDDNAFGITTVSEKCLRSRKIPFRVSTENEDNKCDSIEMPNDSEDDNAFGNATVSVKCLRSRKIPFRVSTENEELTTYSIEFDDNSNVTRASSEKKQSKQRSTSFFVGDPIPDEEARERWHWRYELKSQRCKGRTWKLNADEEDEVILNVECHYTRAKVDGCIFNLGDCAYIKGDGRHKYVGRILEFFKTMEGDDYFRVQWFYKAQDTVMKDAAVSHDKKRLFYSSLMNDNLLDCIVSKVTVIQMPPMLGLKPNSIPSSDFYYDMEYCVEYSTFRNLITDTSVVSRDSCSPNQFETLPTSITMTRLEDMPYGPCKHELALLDLYAGCGGMSTGLCLGARLSNVNLVTKWAVDCDSSACDSLKLNHPETLVRNESADDFLELLKEWEKLCKKYVVNDLERTLESESKDTREAENNISSPSDAKTHAGECEVSSLVDICYGEVTRKGKRGLKFKVRWKGYGPNEDTWEPIEGLSNCEERLKEFVRSGFRSKILPRPGDVDVICGGPPCQGISGYNRYRNVDSPLDDERNRQIIVFMDIVKFFKPKYVLMENVVDILRFDKGSLGRYALSRLVNMKYQARLGVIAAGCYGVPQFRLRVFLWGALPSEKLPQFPLPTHDVVVRYWPPAEFEQNTVAYNEGQPRELEEALILRDALSDLPAVTTHEIREEMTYEMPPETEFQRYIRLSKHEMMGFTSTEATEAKTSILYDHRPRQLSEDDYLRVCQIPHVKGANFRDLPGVVVGVDNVVRRDPTKEQVMLPSGKPLVPNCVLTFEQGKSKRPYGRLWWDETVGTVVTVPYIRSQVSLHPEQDRVLTIREYARLQGFPDYYRFCGTVKERYCQVGNAVAVPVSRALGYTLGMAFRKLSGNEPLATLPPKFSYQRSPDENIDKSMTGKAL